MSRGRGLMLRNAKVCVLDQLLLERYRGKVGRGLAVRLSRRRDNSRRLESLFTPFLTNLSKESQDSDNGRKM
jgi:hypothetical protein